MKNSCNRNDLQEFIVNLLYLLPFPTWGKGKGIEAAFYFHNS